ncbi:tetratricopeptide repeat protein [Streptomyces drozdowiczii]|uniref:Tetratricopeptide repeat protein n=1 Tax=Streptomyces drozdowiczii TaxID=202862 RepID=A0ABY6PXL2_9ACTN|nr:tetratricopeptide repeat protein [Streptomyces drozdowiczii]MCX0243534.1 tetratricopeptide repeat protein [Streptomyces drozdowiczii]UZK56556.1 tetratricopeptide repeat protein [Streptomyces drozdowiczii]
MSRGWKVAAVLLTAGCVAEVVRRGRRTDWVARAYRELDVRDRTLREEAPETVGLRHEAHRLRELGDATAALEVHGRLLAARADALGADHPQVLITRFNHAGHLWEAGDRAGALAAYEEVLADMVRVQGEDHTDTQWTRKVLASRKNEAEGAP